MTGWEKATLDEIPLVSDGRAPWRPVRHHLGIRAFGVNAWVAREAGERVINEHTEEGADEELYLVLSGHAAFTIDGEEVDVPEGTLVFVEPAARRTAFAREANTTILAVGAIPGKTYLPSGWELWAPANPHFEAGDYERAIAMLLPVVHEHPD